MKIGADDPRFLERLKLRDERAFNEMVRLYERQVYGLVFRMLGRRDEAEDMTQEVFVQVFKAIDQFRGDSKLSTWVYRIAVNLCKNRSKYLSRRHADEQDDVAAVAERVPLHQAKGVTAATVDRPDDLYDGHEVERIVQRCISQVDDDFRSVLILRDVEELSYEEIAQITELPEGTVKSRIHRGRAQLKALVEGALGEKLL
jgi:RNA polymerase sigma-70 factor (ECF subfamily)